MYKPTEWKDRVVERPRTFTLNPNPDGSTTLTPAPGAVLEEGTPVSASTMNPISQTLFDVFAQTPFLENAETQLIYEGETLVQVDETIATVLHRRTTLSYVEGELASVNVKLYDQDGVTVLKDYTDVLNYENGTLVSVGRAKN